MNELIENIDKLHTTEMGLERIKRNLSLEDSDVVQWCRTGILDCHYQKKRKELVYYYKQL